jgi:dienelactone hydrolase
VKAVAAAIAMLALGTIAVPQSPAATLRYDDRPVVVGVDPWRLPGTLSVPRSSRPVPGVVIVHGSGPVDRDGTVGSVKPYRDLAVGLAAAGVAVLRYDKRTVVHGARVASIPNPTVKDETIDDAVAAAALLRRARGVDGGRVFILGHSMGGMLVPRIAKAESGAAGFILMAAPARPLEDVILEQVQYIASADGVVTDAEKSQVDSVRRIVDRIKDPNLQPSTPASELLGVPASYWLDLRGYDPVVEARGIRARVLILHGGRDYQVTDVDFQRWQAAFSTVPAVRLKRYPRLNHLFVPGSGPSTPAEYQRPGHVDASVIRDIADWIAPR